MMGVLMPIWQIIGLIAAGIRAETGTKVIPALLSVCMAEIEFGKI